jgi:hypothetical protein
MSEPTPPPPSEPWATDVEVKTTLGKIGSRVEAAGIDIDAHISRAHSQAVDRLVKVYATRTLPAFTGDALEAAKWAEAQLAAANILDILRASLDSVSDLPERLRASAWETLDAGLPGFRPGDPTPGADDPPFPPETAGSSGRHSAAAASAFPDPYLDPFGLYPGWVDPAGRSTWVL